MDNSNTSISWVSSNKERQDTTIQINNITEIIVHSIEIAQKFKYTAPEELSHLTLSELQRQQFTIRYVEHAKNTPAYLPQLSPNNSATNTMHRSHPSNQQSNSFAPRHGSKNSSSFMRSLKHGHAKQTSLIPTVSPAM